MSRRRGIPSGAFGTTVNYRGHAIWQSRSTVLASNPPGHGPLRQELAQFVSVVRALPSGLPLILDSTSGRLHPDLLAIVVASMLPRSRRPVIVLMGAMWERDSGARGVVQRLIVRRADRAIAAYALQSTEELTAFAGTWGVDPSKLRFVPYFFTLTDVGVEDVDVVDGGYVFSGGDSHRDYEPLLEAARRLPDVPFVLATAELDGRTDLPPNVTSGRVSHHEFAAALAGASAVVVPLRTGLPRAAGQQTYLNAMWLEKPTIVTDTIGVRDHVRPGETAVVVDPTPDGYHDALQWVFDPANHDAVATMRAAARADVHDRFTFEGHADAVLAVLDDVVAAHARKSR